MRQAIERVSRHLEMPASKGLRWMDCMDGHFVFPVTLLYREEDCVRWLSRDKALQEAWRDSHGRRAFVGEHHSCSTRFTPDTIGRECNYGHILILPGPLRDDWKGAPLDAERKDLMLKQYLDLQVHFRRSASRFSFCVNVHDVDCRAVLRGDLFPQNVQRPWVGAPAAISLSPSIGRSVCTRIFGLQ